MTAIAHGCPPDLLRQTLAMPYGGRYRCVQFGDRLDRESCFEGNRRYAEIQRKLAALPAIAVPAITLDGDGDGVSLATDGSASAPRFAGRRVHRVVPRAGHNLPQEPPEVFAAAVMELVKA